MQVSQKNPFVVFVLLCSFIFCQALVGQNLASNSINIPTTQLSFFERNSNGALMLDKQNRPYQGKQETVTSNVEFSPANTALFVIDPWNDMPSDFLNQYYGKIIQSYILPLTQKASASGFPTYIFTNDCKAIKPVPYSCKIPEKFNSMAKAYPYTEIIYWQDLKVTTFIKSLREQGIKHIIYTGFSSNVCIIGRPIGMINMLQEGFSLYFIPKASAALETQKTWKSQKIHHATTTIISQWMAKLIKYDDIFSKLQ